VSPAYGSKLSRQIALRYVMTHAVAFREYFVPQVSRRRYWGRYTFSPVLLGMAEGDSILLAGRGTGKSMSALEPEIVRESISRPGEETMLTALRKVHVIDRMERAIDYFELPLFKPLVARITRSPAYMIELKNGHMLYGVSVGDDPEAKMAQGKHVSTLLVEEAHQYPERAWLKLQGAKDPRGCRTLMAGVPDGRLDTPFRRADGKLNAFETRRFRISRRSDPYFDQKTKADLAETLGGEEHDTYMQEVDAEWGNPVWSAWDLDAIYRCMEDTLPVSLVEVSGKLYRQQGLTPRAVVLDLIRPQHQGAPIYIGMDVGYSQPSEIGVFEWWQDRWRLIARARLTNRMEHDDQAEVLYALFEWFDAQKVGIDTTEGEGRAIAHMIENDHGEKWKGLKDKVVRVTFTETFLSGYTPEAEEVWEPARSIGTRTLRGLFARQIMALPRDENIPMEFNQEREQRNADGTTKVITPPTVHITDMMRVFAVMVFLETPVSPPDGGNADVFGDLVWGDSPSPWAPTPI
jgi:hypothetical protein